MGRKRKYGASVSLVKSQSPSLVNIDSAESTTNSPCSSSDSSKDLQSFRFPQNRIYSHKGNTILIHQGNFDQFEDIVNYEIASTSAKERGFIVLHLHDEIRPLISDESVLKFLIQSGDHDGAKYKMSPGIYTYGNVYSRHTQGQPLGLICLKFLLDSIKSGKSVPELIELHNKQIMKSQKTLDDDKEKEEEVDKDNSSQLESSESNEKNDKNPVPVLLSMWEDIVPDKLVGNFRGGRFVDHKYLNEQGKMIKKCPCSLFNSDHSINDLHDQSRRRRPLLHEAYLGQSRLHSLSDPPNSTDDGHIALNRLNESELRDCERILSRMLQGMYNCEYMIHEGFIYVEGQNSLFGSTKRTFDLQNTRNPIDDCFRGTSKTGISYPWTYIGFAGSIFASHVEDIAYLNSVNVMLYGSPKVWIFLGEDEAVTLQQKTFEYLEENAEEFTTPFLKCTLQHKSTFVHPVLLELWGIPYTVVVQKPGDVIYTCGGAFHSGFNLGVNVNLAKNTIQTDYKLRMLKELYIPANDPYRCKPRCPQNQLTYLEDGSTGAYLLSFYNMLFKCQRGNKEDVAFHFFLSKLYSGVEIGPDPVDLDEEIKPIVQKKLLWKLDQVKKELLQLKEKVIESMPRLMAEVIVERKVSFSIIPDLEIETHSTNLIRFPSDDFTLPQAEENVILNQMPFTHILVSHSRYGSSDEMRLSTNSELSSNHDEVKEIAKDMDPLLVWRTFQYFNDLNKYWINLNNDTNFAEVSVCQVNPEKNHNNMIEGVSILKTLATQHCKSFGAERIRKMNSLHYSADEEDIEKSDQDSQVDSKVHNLSTSPDRAEKTRKLSSEFILPDLEESPTQMETNSTDEMLEHATDVSVVYEKSQHDMLINLEQPLNINEKQEYSNTLDGSKISASHEHESIVKQEEDVMDSNLIDSLIGIPGSTDSTTNVKPKVQDANKPVGYQILAESHNLLLIKVKTKLYYVCTVCFNFHSNIAARSTDLAEKNKTNEEIENEIEKALRRQTGVTVEAYNMRQHIRKFIKELKCSHCTNSHQFKTKHALACHIRTVHQNHFIYCPLCSKRFKQPSHLRQHWSEPETACIQLVFSQGKGKKVMGFECRSCQVAIHKREQWLQHIQDSPKCIGRQRSETVQTN